MKSCTLLFLIKDDEILLAMKKRGFGAGRWNGVGGKIEQGETVEQALIRECQEEINVTPNAVRKVGVLDFAFPTGEFDMRVHAYVCENWEGEPSESEEMAPKWFKQNDLPYKEMWSDDEYWVPQVLAGKLVKGTFTFDDKDQLLSHDMSLVNAFEDVQ